MSPRSRRALLFISALLAAFAVAVFASGGFVTTVAGFRLSSRSPLPAAIGASIALIAWLVAARRSASIVDDLARLDASLARRANAIVVATALVAGAASLRYSTFSASGSDASGYLSQAAMLWRGELSHAEPLAHRADWFDAPATLAPLGWRAAADGQQVPTYPIGLPMLMAPLHALGGIVLACALVPLLLVVAVAATGTIASRVAGPAAGIVAAVWLATSPIALYEAMQPMSDVPVTAAWLVCWWLCFTVISCEKGGDPGASSRPDALRAACAGFACAAAVLIRPNLAPLAAVPLLYLLIADRGRARTLGWRRAIVFAVPVAFAGLAVAYLQQRWFGSALRSGYGTASEIYSSSNVAPNVALYTMWLVETHGPWLLAAPIAWWWPASRQLGTPAVAAMRWLLAFAALVCAGYLFYSAFEVWTYLRFLLPALAIAMIAVATLVFAPVAHRPSIRGPLLVTAILALAALNIRGARNLDVFRLADRHARAAWAGPYLSVVLPSNAVIVSSEQSGALRYYTGRSIVRWDLATPAALTAAFDRLAANGDDVWVALDEWEEDLFRRKAAKTSAADLDWPPAAEAGRDPRTRVWRLRDRARFMRGESVHTDRLR